MSDVLIANCLFEARLTDVCVSIKQRKINNCFCCLVAGIPMIGCDYYRVQSTANLEKYTNFLT